MAGTERGKAGRRGGCAGAGEMENKGMARRGYGAIFEEVGEEVGLQG